MVCLLLLLAVLAATVMAIRSIYVPDLLQIYRQQHVGALADRQESYQYWSGYGIFTLSWGFITFEYDDAADAAKWRTQSGYTYDNRFTWNYAHQYTQRESHILGFGFRTWDDGTKAHGWVVALPWLAFVVVFAVAPAIRLRQFILERRRRQRRLLGQCVQCAYDLRGSGARCPECGEETGNLA